MTETTMNGPIKMDKDKILTVIIRAIIIVWAILLLASIFVLLSDAKAAAAEVKLTWDHNDPLPEGYRVYMRTEDNDYNYETPVWDGKENVCTIDGLLPATQYYFVVRAYIADDSSGDSNEVTYKPDIPAPVNLRIELEISVYIDVNGKPIIAHQTVNP